MEQQRNILFILFLTLSLFIYWSWESDKITLQQQEELQAQRIEMAAAAESSEQAVGKLITLQSDTLNLTLSSVGGDVVDAKLLQVKQELGKDDPFHLLMRDPLFVYEAQSGLIGANGPDSKARPTYTSAQNSYVLAEGEDSVSAVLTFSQDGVDYTKTYTLKRGSYVVDVTYDVQNHNSNAVSMALPMGDNPDASITGAVKFIASTQSAEISASSLPYALITSSCTRELASISSFSSFSNACKPVLSCFIGSPRIDPEQSNTKIHGVRSLAFSANSTYGIITSANSSFLSISTP